MARHENRAPRDHAPSRRDFLKASTAGAVSTAGLSLLGGSPAEAAPGDVLVEGSRIVEVGPNLKPGNGAGVIDARGRS